GKLYPVNQHGGEVYGMKCYSSLRDIPGPVDFVISAVPAHYTPQLVTDSAAKGVKAIQMFTAGFSESGDETGKQLEQQVLALARQHGIRIIGPNCMGLYCPKTRLTFHQGLPAEAGAVGYMVQSGGNAIFGIREGDSRGIHFSKVISYGNAIDLDESDYLDYLTDDPDTKLIAAYIEGVKDGRRFMEVLRRAARTKPVVVYKGGITETGMRTAASHTSSIAGHGHIWQALLAQMGAIQVGSIEELNDLLLLFTYTTPPRGRNTAIIGMGGGASVHAVDAAAQAGLVIPVFPDEIRQRLKAVFGSGAGSIFTNPLDMYAFYRRELIQQTIQTVAESDRFDLLILHLPLDIYIPITPQSHTLGPYVESIINLKEAIKRRTVVVLHFITSDKSKQLAHEAQSALHRAGFPIFPSVSRAAGALDKFIKYHQRQG
ncbi:MAG: CoA-binding protein, partial [Chloroflexota bacterium]